MEEGPFRMSRSADRSAHRSAAAGRNAAELEIEDPKPTLVRPASSSPRAAKDKKPPRRFVWLAAAAVVVVVVAAVAWAVWSGTRATTAIDSSKYQAVFFTNGQVYFGKLQQFNGEYLKLTDIYYLQTPASSEEADPKNPQQTSSEGNPTLIKLGDEIHGPEDEMIISKDQVLFYENLKKDGKVSQSIEKYKKPN